MSYPCIPVVIPTALKGHKNGQLPANLLARVKTGGQMYAPVAEEFNKLYDAAMAAGFKLRNVGDYRSFEGQLSMFMDRYTLQDLGRHGEKAWCATCSCHRHCRHGDLSQTMLEVLAEIKVS